MARVLLVSTYELGVQPLGVALPAALLEAAGHEVRVSDLSLGPAPAGVLEGCDALVASVPMHTALRLALEAVAGLRASRPELRVCYLGLYAPVAARSGALRAGDAAIVEPGTALLGWLADAPDAPVLALGRASRPTRPTSPPLPRRELLPGLAAYARMVDDRGEHLVAAVEASRGCNHRCRHCPVPIVYEGRSEAVDLEAVAADLARVVELGATHVRFADPDFLNRPQHALRVARLVRERHPGLSFDATIKVSHLRRHRALLGELARCGLTFVVSAFETTSDLVLERLDKGHRREDLGEAVQLLRGHGVEIRPSLLPFTPWTTRADLLDLLDFVAAYDLVDNVDPIQYAIRLLLPPGSLVLERDDPVLAGSLLAYDDDALGYPWRSLDPALDSAQREVAAVVESALSRGEAPAEVYAAVRACLVGALGLRDDGPPRPVSTGPPPAARPRLTEAWFCCAEPSAAQLSGVTASVPLGLPTRRDIA